MGEGKNLGKENETIKLVLGFKNKEDFDKIFTFLWNSLKKQVVKTKESVSFKTEDR